MTGTRTFRLATVAAVAAALSACATAPNPWTVHERTTEARAAAAHRSVCPVELANGTDENFEARYVASGQEAELGFVPAGSSLRFGVSCDDRSIEAMASSSDGFFGRSVQYRKVAALDRSSLTRVELTVADRIR